MSKPIFPHINPYVLGKQYGARTAADGYLRVDPDSDEFANPHILIAGTSGSGKSILIKDLIKHLASVGKTLFVFDLHGDLETEGENHIEYTARNTDFGINPFEFDVCLKNGGPLVRVGMIVGMFKKNFMPTMGAIQEAVLKNLLIDTYKSKGIYDNKPETWPFKDNDSLPEHVGMSAQEAEDKRGGKPENKLPTMADLLDVYDKVVQFNSSVDKSSPVSLMEFAYKTRVKMINANGEASRNRYEGQLQEGMPELEKSVEMFMEFVRGERDNIPPHDENDVIDYKQYESKKAKSTLETLSEYIKTFASMNIFIQKKPNLIRGINRFDISGFTNVDNPKIALFFIDLSIQRIFRKSKILGEYKNRPNAKGRVGSYIVCDESRLVLPNGKEKDNPFNIINRGALEARKYGLGFIFASQRINHYNSELLANIYTKIILKTDSADVSETLTKLGLKGLDILSEVNKKEGLAVLCRTGKQPQVAKMNIWEHLLDGKPHISEEMIQRGEANV